MNQPRLLHVPVRSATLWLSIVLGLAAAGCSDGNPPTHPVRGSVRFPEGAPVKTGTVELYSDKYNVNARGQIQRDGTFELTTFQPSDGAVEGEHRAIVVQFLAAEWLPEIEHHHGDPVAVRFADYETSKLTVSIRPDGPNAIELVVDRQSPR